MSLLVLTVMELLQESKLEDSSLAHPIAMALGVGFVPLRKPGKLPGALTKNFTCFFALTLHMIHVCGRFEENVLDQALQMAVVSFICMQLCFKYLTIHPLKLGCNCSTCFKLCVMQLWHVPEQ